MSQKADLIERRLFASLDTDNNGVIQTADLLIALVGAGLDPNHDPRLAEMNQALSESSELDIDQFVEAIRPDIGLIKRALRGELVIPDFESFREELSVMFKETEGNKGGQNATYIPPLAEVDPEHFGVAVCSIDGQRLTFGNCEDTFSVQSATKPLTYAFAVEEHGLDRVHQHVGFEPSGLSFNEYALKDNKIPHNPLINSGAIMCAGMLGRKYDKRVDRVKHIRERWSRLTGGVWPTVNQVVYEGESRTGHRNRALAYMMHNEDAFKGGVYGEIDEDELKNIVETYFTCCAFELNASDLATVAATLASGGICPTTDERVLQSRTVRACMSLMDSCGMYDFSGEFAFRIGLPAKSGVGGGLIVVVPGLMGLCIWSPRLDGVGNSVRGVEFSKRLVDTFAVHSYDNLGGAVDKINLRVHRVQAQARRVEEFIWAASKGDLHTIQRLAMQELDPGAPDYDGRTPLHLAAAEGHEEVITELFNLGVEPNPADRWGGTPMDDAVHNGHAGAAALLRQHGGKQGRQAPMKTEESDGESGKLREYSVPIIFAAARGDLVTLRRLIARGVNLHVADYDRRTPLHLAAAEGHLAVVQYLSDHGVLLTPRDRWGNTPLDEARANNHEQIVRFLEERIANSTEKTLVH